MPTIVGSVDPPGTGYGIAVASNHAYVAGGHFYVVDVSNPVSPVIAGSAYTPGFAQDVDVSGSHAYISAYPTGLLVFNVTSPAAPMIEGGVSLSFPYGSPRAVAVDARHVFVAEVTSGEPGGAARNAREGVYMFQIFPAQCSGTTSVELSSLTATSVSEGILLTWSTAYDSDLLGFHVHRSTGSDGDYVRVSTGLIEPSGPYRFLDAEVTAGTTYSYRLEAFGLTGETQLFGPVSARFDINRLAQSFPNPFPPGRPFTDIRFNIAKASPVTLRIFDASGRLVRILMDETLDAGAHAVAWDGKNGAGEAVGSGIYFYRLRAGEFSATRELVRLR
jgi:hypothetical protein